ncbi:MAG: LytTR family DNA-binding domain-containing protein [Methylococcaceae bacterium]
MDFLALFENHNFTLFYDIIQNQHPNGNTVKVKLMHGEVLDGVHTALNRWKIDYELSDFMQIHKSHLVNLNHVNGLKPDFYRVEGYNVTFLGCIVELAIGKHYLDDLRKALGRPSIRH